MLFNYTNLLHIIGIIAGSFLLWFVVIVIIARVGGWGKMAERFPYTSSTGEVGEKRVFQSIKIGMSNYGGIVMFESLSFGLHMSTIILFKPGHQDILIPWRELRVEQASGIMYGNMYKFAMESLPNTFFYTHKKLGDWIIEQQHRYIS